MKSNIIILLFRFYKKLQSVLLLCVTISLLFYYTFQNEIDMLNSYAENESLPSVNFADNFLVNSDRVLDNNKDINDKINGDIINELQTDSGKSENTILNYSHESLINDDTNSQNKNDKTNGDNIPVKHNALSTSENDSSNDSNNNNNNIPNNVHSKPNKVMTEANHHDLLNKLREKNKYFPLLLNSPLEDPSLKSNDIENIELSKPELISFKEKYPTLWENDLPLENAINPNDLNAGGSLVGSSKKIDNPFKQDKFDLIAKSKSLIQRQRKVKDILLKTWDQQSSQWKIDPWPIALVDCLDTLFITNELTKFNEVVGLIKKIDFSLPNTFNELINIPDVSKRLLGGLISAYELSHEEVLLTKAKQVGDFILRAYDTPNRLPILNYPWKSTFGNRFPYKETNAGEMLQMTLELTRLTQLTSDNKYYNAVSHTLQFFWNTMNKLPIKSLLPNIVDASSCKMLTQRELNNGDHQRDSQTMKSIDKQLKFVYCHQLQYFTNYSTKIDANSELFTVYDTMAKLVALTDVDILHHFQLNELATLGSSGSGKDKRMINAVMNSEKKIDGLDGIARNEKTVDNNTEDTITNSTTIFHEAMLNIIKLMSFKPKSNLDLTLLSDIDTNSIYSPTTNELEVQIRRNFKYNPESCLLPSVLLYGNRILSMTMIDKEDKLNNKFVNYSNDILKSCYQLNKMFQGNNMELVLDLDESIDWDENYDITDHSSDTDNFMQIEEKLYDADQKINDVLQDKYVGFDKGFPNSNIVSAKKIKQNVNSNLINWKRLYRFINGEQFLNVKLDKEAVDIGEKKWTNINGFTGVNSRNDNFEKIRDMEKDRPMWINSKIPLGQLLSPHLIKSILYQYKITGNESWREMGWTLFEQMIDQLREQNMGAKGLWKIKDLYQENIPSYWMSQTLKYYYLLFDDDSNYSFNEYILTNGGHFLVRPKKQGKKA